MQTRKLRALEVSEIGIGCIVFSHGYGAAPDREYSIQAIQMAFDHGCTFFDTAESYGTHTMIPGRDDETKQALALKTQAFLKRVADFDRKLPRGCIG